VGQQPWRRADAHAPDPFLWAVGHTVGTVGDHGNSLTGCFGDRFLQGPDAIKARSSIRRNQPLLVGAERSGGNSVEIPVWTLDLDVDANRSGIAHRHGDPSTRMGQ